MDKYSGYVQKALQMGAQDAKLIEPKSVVTAEWVRLKCQYGCHSYGRNLSCPPHSPTPEQTRRVLDEYQHAILIDSGRYPKIVRIIPALERAVFLDGFHKVLGFAAGPCTLCEKCTKYCGHPHEARPSMEACGIDVYTTVRDHGFTINVVREETCERHYFGLLLVD